VINIIKYTIIFLLSVVAGTSLYAQDVKVIGYLPYYRFQLIDDIKFDQLTHVNLSFANPDMDGNLSLGGRNIVPVIQAAHAENVEVFLSLAGGALTNEWEAAWEHLMETENRSAFIHKIIEYTTSHNIQGIDMDLEWSHVNEKYSGFVLELKDSCDVYDITFTAAFPGTYRYPDITAEALATFEWINMMVYDLRGPWDPSNPGPHSPMSFALSSIQYWENQGVDKENLMLGMPFYGYDFSDPTNVRAKTYNQIVDINPQNAMRDRDGQIYYNGIPTIRAKTQLAIDELSGVMMWELGQDHFGEFSLLDEIHDVVQASISGVTSRNELQLNIYPNPFEDFIRMTFDEMTTADIQIFDAMGRLIMSDEISESYNYMLHTFDLGQGMYTILITTSESQSSRKLLKK